MVILTTDIIIQSLEVIKALSRIKTAKKFLSIIRKTEHIEGKSKVRCHKCTYGSMREEMEQVPLIFFVIRMSLCGQMK